MQTREGGARTRAQFALHEMYQKGEKTANAIELQLGTIHTDCRFHCITHLLLCSVCLCASWFYVLRRWWCTWRFW